MKPSTQTGCLLKNLFNFIQFVCGIANITTLNVFRYCLQLNLGRITHIMIQGLHAAHFANSKRFRLTFSQFFSFYCIAVVEQFTYSLHSIIKDKCITIYFRTCNNFCFILWLLFVLYLFLLYFCVYINCDCN